MKISVPFPRLRAIARPMPWLGAATLLLGLLTGPLLPHAAGAEISIGRTDPIVRLSDGTLVQLGTTIKGNLSAIQQITYTVHVPAGSSVASVVYTGGMFRSLETVQVAADNPANTYDSDTVVSSSDPDVAVTAGMTIPSLGSSSASAAAGADLALHVAG